MLKEFAANSHQFTKQVETHILLAHPAETRNAVAALASHLTRLRCAAPLLSSVVRNHHVYGTEKLRLDGPTVTNLELLSGPDGGREGSLFGKLDSCVTPGGSRTLREWITGPLRNVGAIQKRQDAVAFFGGFEGSSGNNGGRMGKQSEHSDGGSTGTTTDKNETLGADTAGRLRRGLRRVPDLERCLGRARAASAADARVFPEPLARARHNRRVAAFASVVAAARDAIGFLRDVATYENFELNAPALVKELVGVASLTRLTENGARDALETARSSLDWGAKGGGDKNANNSTWQQRKEGCCEQKIRGKHDTRPVEKEEAGRREKQERCNRDGEEETGRIRKKKEHAKINTRKYRGSDKITKYAKREGGEN